MRSSTPRASTAQRKAHEARQSAVRNLTADEYVVQHADELQRKYEPYFELLRSPPPGVRIFRSRYEEMVTFFPRWLEALRCDVAGAPDDGGGRHPDPNGHGSRESSPGRY